MVVRSHSFATSVLALLLAFRIDGVHGVEYPIVDTNQEQVFDGTTIGSGANFPLQDGLVDGNQPNIINNGDGTVTDQVTGLMWTQAAGSRVTYPDGVSGASSVSTGGYNDWRVPTTKELYSLIDFSGTDPSVESSGTQGLTPFINDDVFEFAYGSSPFRSIDVQFVTSTIYLNTVMQQQEAFFGVNFADGRIKGYPTQTNRGAQFFAKYVRGPSGYGDNNFVAEGEDAIRDLATGLMWQKGDATNKNWQEALQYCDEVTLAGKSDWRLPNAKELHSIVDYSRSPGTTSSAAIDAIFDATKMTNEAGEDDYGAYWSSTTHLSSSAQRMGDAAVVMHFGRALGFMDGQNAIDVHGAGAQRSEPKAGDPAQFATGRGPQGDVVRIYNMARCVRDAGAGETRTGSETTAQAGGRGGPETTSGVPVSQPEAAGTTGPTTTPEPGPEPALRLEATARLEGVTLAMLTPAAEEVFKSTVAGLFAGTGTGTGTAKPADDVVITGKREAGRRRRTDQLEVARSPGRQVLAVGVEVDYEVRGFSSADAVEAAAQTIEEGRDTLLAELKEDAGFSSLTGVSLEFHNVDAVDSEAQTSTPAAGGRRRGLSMWAAVVVSAAAWVTLVGS